MTNKKQQTIARVTSLLSELDQQESFLINEIEKLSLQPDSESINSGLLRLFVHTTFDEDEAENHWDRIFEKLEYYRNELKHDFGLRVAIFDYFINLNKTVSSPVLVEMRVIKAAEKMAMLDALTGLYNRRYLDMTLLKEARRALRHDSIFSVVMLDVDNFKAINDSYGHIFGDEVLKRMAAVLTDISREEDIACRYGGEEFVVVLPETGSEGAVRFAERLRDRMRKEEPFLSKQITVSGGIATFPQNATEPARLLEIADSALYKAKFSGKDRILTGD
ncbi:MAG: GGDEF domain-containing protein [Gammaproteobacteria bacterium]